MSVARPEGNNMRLRSPEFRTAVFYATFFMTPGAAATFLPIWLSEQGIDAGRIGVINAMPILVMLAINVFVGRVADRASDWRQVIVLASLVGAVMPVGLFFASEFWSILLVWTLATLPIAAINPVADAAAVRMTRRRGSDFGAIRAWGTLGFMAVNAVTGIIVAWFGSPAFVPLIFALALMRGGASLQLPRFRAPPSDEVVPPPARSILVAGKTRELFRPWFALPLVGNAVILATHMLLNAFAALVWRDAGIPASIIGPLIALGAAAEAVMMFLFRRFSKRFSARYLILIAALASALRWGIMAFNPPVAVLVVLQLSHSVTFALGYLGGVNFIANWTSDDIAAEAQSVFVVIQQAMTVLALTGFGYLVTVMGARAFMVSAAFSLVAGGAVWVSLGLMTTARERAESAE